MNIPKKYRDLVVAEIKKRDSEYKGSKENFCRFLGLNRIKFEGIRNDDFSRITDDDWLRIGSLLKVNYQTKNWQAAKTIVFKNIENNLIFCKENNKSMILVDECGIGKTFCARYVLKGMVNGFYVDCSQGKNRRQFFITLAKSLGLDSLGTQQEVKDRVKNYISLLENPLIVLDEFGDLDYTTMLDIKELWNSTEGNAGWYIMGADGLKAKITRGIENQKVGYAELFSRFSDSFIRLTPTDPQKKKAWRIHLLESVAKVNCSLASNEISQIARSLADADKTLRNLQTKIELGV